jgi:hypothetical protein
MQFRPSSAFRSRNLFRSVMLALLTHLWAGPAGAWPSVPSFDRSLTLFYYAK